MPGSDQTNVELIRDLIELGDRVSGMRATISAAFEASADDDLESIRLDDAACALQPATAAIEDAIDKIAAHEGRQRALTTEELVSDLHRRRPDLAGGDCVCSTCAESRS